VLAGAHAFSDRIVVDLLFRYYYSTVLILSLQTISDDKLPKQSKPAKQARLPREQNVFVVGAGWLPPVLGAVVLADSFCATLVVVVVVVVVTLILCVTAAAAACRTTTHTTRLTVISH